VARFDIGLSFRPVSVKTTNPTQQPGTIPAETALPDRFAKSAARKLVKGRVVKTCYYMRLISNGSTFAAFSSFAAPGP
jgi:hypothetical protein